MRGLQIRCHHPSIYTVWIIHTRPYLAMIISHWKNAYNIISNMTIREWHNKAIRIVR